MTKLRKRHPTAAWFWRPFAITAGATVGVFAAALVGMMFAAVDEWFRTAWYQAKVEERLGAP